jgi:hypothetical protein
VSYHHGPETLPHSVLIDVADPLRVSEV